MIIPNIKNMIIAGLFVIMLNPPVKYINANIIAIIPHLLKIVFFMIDAVAILNHNAAKMKTSDNRPPPKAMIKNLVLQDWSCTQGMLFPMSPKKFCNSFPHCSDSGISVHV